MADGRRILAISVDDALFDKLSEYVKDHNITKQQFVAEALRKEISQRLEQEQKLKDPEITTQKTWNEADVKQAIDDFIISNGRVPSQKEYKNENGLPSYNAAGRALDETPSQYANRRAVEIANMPQQEKIEPNGTMMSM